MSTSIGTKRVEDVMNTKIVTVSENDKMEDVAKVFEKHDINLVETTNTVFQVHGESHSELKEVNEIVKRVHATILPHLNDEEKRVFPAVRSLADGNLPSNTAELLEEMKTEHEELGADLHRLNALTDGFAEPAGACAKYREMLAGLKALENDLHAHVHLENNVLLPRALSLLETASR